MSARYQERVANIEKILLLSNLQIDQDLLADVCQSGVPDKFRPLVWRLFLNYLPRERHLWKRVLEEQRAGYTALIEHFIVKVEKDGSSDEGKECDKTYDDHPLADNQQSQWTNYFKDNGVLRQIDNDVRRLRPEIDFFQRKTAYGINTGIRLTERLHSDCLFSTSGLHSAEQLSDKSFINGDSSLTNQTYGTSFGEPSLRYSTSEKHWEVVERILFIFAKTNRGIGYVQGLNEIVCPIYFAFASDPDDEWARFAEADCFYCFQNLISEIKDLFIRDIDSEHCGIDAILTRFHRKFAQLSPNLYNHLVIHQQIKPQYYAFRWISLLLSQEFSLPDLINIWDSLLASPPDSRIERVECICLAMLQVLEDELMDGDFGRNVRLLQNFPEHKDISRLIIRSIEIYKECLEVKLAEQDAKTQICPENNNSIPTSKPLQLSMSMMKCRFKNLINDTTTRLTSVCKLENGKEGQGCRSDRP